MAAAADGAPRGPAAGAPRRRLERTPRRAGRGELVSAASALVLLISMFAFAWFGVDGIPGRTKLTSVENAWDGMTLVRWLMLATIVAALGAPVLHATQRTHGSKTSTGLAVAVLGALTAAFLVYRVLIDPPSPTEVVDQKLGAFVGLGAALAIALGGYDSVREERGLEQASSDPLAAGPSAR
jgi:hypothetical protein